jgi:uncharacterized membrane protein
VTDQSQVPVDLYIAAYNDPNAAQADWDAIKQLAQDDVITVEALVLVNRDMDGKIDVKDNFHTVGVAAGLGAAGGLLIGLIFPPAFLASGVVGGAVGAGVGGLVSAHRESEIKKDVEDVLPPGSSGIITLFDITWKPKVDEALSKASKIDEEDVDADSAAKLKEEASKA